MKNTLGIGHFIILLIAVAIAILIVTTAYSFVNEGEITFVDEIDNVETGESSSSDELYLSNSNEYKSWKNTTDTTFKSLYNGNQAETSLRCVRIWLSCGQAMLFLKVIYPREDICMLLTIFVIVYVPEPRGKRVKVLNQLHAGHVKASMFRG